MEEKVYETLSALGITFERVSHPPVFTSADYAECGVPMDGTLCKNLFVRNANKSRYYVVSLALSKQISMKELQEKLGESKLSFGNEQVLQEKLGVTPGSVSLLNIVNTENSDVVFVVDKELLDSERIGFHPNVNTATVLLSPRDITAITTHYGVAYRVIRL